MAFLFKRNPRTPSEVVKSLNDQLAKLDSTERRKALEETNRCLTQVKLSLFGDEDAEPSAEQTAATAQEIFSTDTLIELIAWLPVLEFDARKDVFTIFSGLLRWKIGSRLPAVEYVQTRPQILSLLIKEQENAEVYLVAGPLLRECIRHGSLAVIVLNSPLVWNLFAYCQLNTFEVATDAFSTLRDLLTLHSKLVAEFFGKNMQNLLATLILNRSNHSLLTTYVDSPENLKLAMILLNDKSKNIQYEAFHVFKVFVANPHKSKPVTDILVKNRERLVYFLQNFTAGRKDDCQFLEERDFLVRNIEELPSIVDNSSEYTSGSQ